MDGGGDDDAASEGDWSAGLADMGAMWMPWLTSAVAMDLRLLKAK